MKNDLNELNSVMFDALRGLKEGSVDIEKAKAMASVGGVIINNAKTQIAAAKLLKGKVIKADVFGCDVVDSEPVKKITGDNLYDSKTKFAMAIGYDTVGKAISDMGKNNFERDFKEFDEVTS